MKEIDEEYPESLVKFETDVKAIMDKNGIQEEHAACYLCNFGDEYICKTHNGGCNEYETCKQMHKSCNN